MAGFAVQIAQNRLREQRDAAAIASFTPRQHWTFTEQPSYAVAARKRFTLAIPAQLATVFSVDDWFALVAWKSSREFVSVMI